MGGQVCDDELVAREVPSVRLDVEQIGEKLDSAISCERVKSEQRRVSSQRPSESEQNERLVLMSNLSGRHICVESQGRVETLVNQLGRMLEPESNLLKQLGGCSKDELISLVLLWLVHRGQIAVSGASSCWARIQGLEQQSKGNHDWNPVQLQCNWWTFSIPRCLSHRVVTNADESSDNGEVAVLIKVNQWKWLEYRVDKYSNSWERDSGAMHSKKSFETLIPTGVDRRWSTAREWPGLRLGRCLTKPELLQITGMSEGRGVGLFHYLDRTLALLQVEVGYFGPGIITLHASRKGRSRWWRRLNPCCFQEFEVTSVQLMSGALQKRIACRGFLSLVAAIKTLIAVRIRERLWFPRTRRQLRNIDADSCASCVVLRQVLDGGVYIDGRFTSWCDASRICRPSANGRPTETFFMDSPLRIPIGINVAFANEAMFIQVHGRRNLQISQPLRLAQCGERPGVRSGGEERWTIRQGHVAKTPLTFHCGVRPFLVG